MEPSKPSKFKWLIRRPQPTGPRALDPLLALTVIRKQQKGPPWPVPEPQAKSGGSDCQLCAYPGSAGANGPGLGFLSSLGAADLLVLLPSLCQVMNMGLRVLWTCRADLHTLACSAAQLHANARHFQQALLSLTQQDKGPVCLQTLTAHGLAHRLLEYVPCYMARLQCFLRSAAASTCAASLRPHFQQHPSDFMRRSYWICTEGESALGREPLCLILEREVIKPALSAFVEDGHLSSDARQHWSTLVNAALKALLAFILEDGQAFDEAGVRKLHRVLLHLQQHVVELKHSLVEPRAALIQDRAVWSKAEAVVQYLSLQSGPSVPKRPPDSREGLLTRQEREAWGLLAKRRFWHALAWRKRRTTVFVALQLDTSQL